LPASRRMPPLLADGSTHFFSSALGIGFFVSAP
jgi:hypothetical protein